MSTPTAIAAVSALAAGAILRATQEEALLSGPEYIRDAQPEGLTRRIGLGIARAACQAYANDPSRPNAERATQLENACRPYLDSLGGGTGTGIALPFRGGQCAITYVVGTLGSENCPTGPTDVIGFASGPGPISSITSTSVDTGTFPTPIRTTWTVQFADSPRTFVSQHPAGFTPCVRVFPVDPGNTDNCGNPPPEVTEPSPPSTPFVFPIPIVIAPGIDIDADIEINPDGTINIDIGTGDITIDPFGDDSDSGSGGGGGPDDSPPAPEPGPELPGGNGGFGGDDPFGPPPVGRRWVGACITITSNPVNQPPIPGTPPEDVYASVVGNIRLVYDAAGNRQTDTPVRIQAKKVCVWEAVRKLNPVGVSVDIQAGFGYTYRPYSVPLDA